MTAGAIWESDRGTLLRVIVRPNARGPHFITEISEEAVHVNLRGPAREGKANTELVKRLAKSLGVSTADLSVVAGHKSREKTLIVHGLNPTEVRTRLSIVV